MSVCASQFPVNLHYTTWYCSSWISLVQQLLSYIYSQSVPVSDFKVSYDNLLSIIVQYGWNISKDNKIFMDQHRQSAVSMPWLDNKVIQGTEIQEYSKIYLTILSVYNIVIIGIISKKYKVQMDMTMLQRDDLLKCHAHVENFLSKPKFEPLLDFLLCW